MMKMLAIILLSAALAATSLLFAAPDPYDVMDWQADGLPKQRHRMTAETLAGVPADAADEARGFRATAMDLNINWRKPLVWDAPALATEIQLVTAPGDYTCGGFAVFFSRDMASFSITPSALANQEGVGEIPADRLRTLEIAPCQSVPRFGNANMLWAPQLQGIAAGDFIPCVLMVDVPRGTPAGLYRGTLSLSDGEHTLSLDIALRVAGFELPVAGAFGFYFNGNLYRPVDWYNCNQKTFVRENLTRYFAFYRSRRFNSVSLYDNLPDLRLVDGKVTGDFADASAIAHAMNECGLENASLFFDLRDVGYWCYAVAEKLEELGGEAPAGDLGVTMEQRKRAGQEGERYPERAKQLYAEAIRLLLAQAEAEHWPTVRIFADEELGNQFTLKINNYESYMPVIMATARDYAVVIDNGIGWGRTNCTEYGRRDNVPLRQYNSWTDEALDRAEADGAKVMTFNYAPTRLGYGFTQVRCRSLGHHQWADMWDASNYQWQFSRLSEQGVVTSLDMEKSHEGCVDYAACAYLRRLADERAAQGDQALADYAEQILRDVSADLSVNHTTAQNYAYLFSNADLNARRWNVFQAIAKLLGQPSGTALADGKTAMRLDAARRAPPPKNDFILTVRNRMGAITHDAAAPEDFWSDFIGPLTHLAEYETQLRALSSDEDDFRRRNSPSYSVARLASLPEGLAIATNANHVMPQVPFRFERQDDDGDMWQDDSWEFFFGLGDGKSCYLAYNSAGAKVFTNNGEVIPAKDILCFSKSPFNQSGGTVQKLLVPWKYFGLERQPLPGTVWEFNACREMHTHRTDKEAPMSWARLTSSFHESDKWGRLVFSDDGTAPVLAEPVLSAEPAFARLFTSGETIRFNLESRPGGEKTLTLLAVLKGNNGREIAFPPRELPAGNTVLALDTHGLEAGGWTLELQLDGQPLRKSNILAFTILPTPWGK